MHKTRWDPCVAYYGEDVRSFLTNYFTGPDRRVLFVAGAGFDPRSCRVAKCLGEICKNVYALLIKEERPNPPPELMRRAADNEAAILAVFPNHKLLSVDIFSLDGAVVGGRRLVTALNRQYYEDVSDIVVDVSGMSVGTSFPTIRYFVEQCERGLLSVNLHVVVAHDPLLDGNIRRIATDSPGYVHGFWGRSLPSDSISEARLWLPQLAKGRNSALGRLFGYIMPHETCPILPFPARDPRFGDVLAAEYLEEFERSWPVDTRNIVYADEGDPLDLYRTILRLDDLRKPVFAETGESTLVLSPLGSKMMAVGALLAAIERNLPIVQLESVSYEIESDLPPEIEDAFLAHVWLEGDVYSDSRPRLVE